MTQTSDLMKSNRPYTENAFIINPKTVGREEGDGGR